MSYLEPKGVIVDASRANDISWVCVRFDRMDSGPVAPAGLYVDPKIGQERFQLHKLARKDGMLFYFETYNSTHPLPIPDEVYFYRGWWLQEAMEGALDSTAIWEKEVYPVNEGHEHCLFTWETISAYSENSEGYRSKHGWITVDAYNKFIRDDIYRLRE